MNKTFKNLSAALFLSLAYFTANAGENIVTAKKSHFANPKPVSLLADKGMNEGGFFFHVGGFLPSRNYLYPVALGNNTSDLKFSTGIDFDLGNMFRVVDLDPMAIGVRATWFYAGYTRMAEDTFVYARALTGSALRFGPYFTYALSDMMAVDLFYQIGANYTIVLDEEWSNGNDGALGAVHELGFGYRISKFSLGASYRFGKVLDMGYDKSFGAEEKTWFQSRTNSLRIFLGIKI